ncbi:Hypothetical protein R9X50_00795900 [Acrodontium crateriforme]|uniref:Ubiquitin-like modifier-activating enzyme ATG7 n=1 Tax=Acrodontium crateriforme TaxID=150365 RepID=A0AAQ3MC49_9PEZI|nr:Hypothetical protein R9X50_00795900 [Acrodontium crateriforme]
MTSTHPLQYAPWTSDIELGFYSALASLKINHDKLDSSARKVLGLYEINHRDSPERSARMQVHGTALTTDETPKGFYRAEGLIRNFNTLEEFRQVDKSAHVERAGRTIWDAINDGTIYSCPSLLCSFSAICYANLKKYTFNYHFTYPCVHSDPQWKLVSPTDKVEDGIKKLGQKETEDLVDSVQTWRYSVDTRQHGFFLAKRIKKDILEAQWKAGMGEIEEEEEDGNMNFKAQKRKKSRTQSLGELGFLWNVASLANYEQGFFDNADADDRFICFADPSTYAGNPGWMLRNLLVLIRQRWHLDDVQVLCYRDTHARREHPTSLVLQLQSAEPVWEHERKAKIVEDMPVMSSSSALRPGDVDAFGELIESKEPEPNQQPEPSTSPPEPVSNAPVPASKIPPMPKVTGWERNEHNKLVSRTVDLAAYMDSSKLADQAVDLNLKLIKWRISPSINLESIKHTSCLLLGAGTLGSYVARGLMGWGVRKISFVDNARVSYSNPVRQPLYDFKDCENGGVKKAERAADMLMQIYPGMDAAGHSISVPMAGHPITDEKSVRRDFETLKDLIEKHDAIFLLMDTRESRWLPTVMAKAAGKIVINAALGFDTYMVMRHGVSAPLQQTEKTSGPTESKVVVQPKDKEDADAIAAGVKSSASVAAASSSTPKKPISDSAEPGVELGCYFCSDVVAPADSLKSATLDQQCTVTRPGAAPLASALAVELLVSIVQHRLRGRAPAPPPLTSTQIATAPPTDPSMPNSHPLGTVPHQIRGFMSTWQNVQVNGPAYESCAACSPKILEAYRNDGWDFVKKALNEKGYVEEVSGLAEVQRRAEEMDADVEWDEEDNDDGSGEGELI